MGRPGCIVVYKKDSELNLVIELDKGLLFPHLTGPHATADPFAESNVEKGAGFPAPSPFSQAWEA